MLDWDNPLEIHSNSKVDIGLVDQTLNKPSNNEVLPNKNKQSPNSVKVVSNEITPINPDDKRVINGQTDINQLAPFKYPWAWNFFLNANILLFSPYSLI